MSNRISLTQLAVERLRPADREVIYWDSNLPGFGLRVSPKGVKTFLLQYRYRTESGKLKERQESLGRLKVVKTVAIARERARQIKDRASAGVDPLGERKALEATKQAEQAAKEFTLSKLVERYMKEYADLNTRASTAAATRGLLKQWVTVLGDRPVGDIAKKDVQTISSASSSM